MIPADVERIEAMARKLRRLRRAVGWFGVAPAGGGWRPRPEDPTAIAAFEARHGVTLDPDLKVWLLVVGFGPGPGGGLLLEDFAHRSRLKAEAAAKPSDETDAGPDAPWRRNAGEADAVDAIDAAAVARYAAAFEAYLAAAATDDDAAWRQPPAIDTRTDWRGGGALCLCHHGCGMFSAITLRGPLRGKVFLLDWGLASATAGAAFVPEGVVRYDAAGRPFVRRDGHYGFLDWFEAWLDAALRRWGR